jgi:hypothetical protein
MQLDSTRGGNNDFEYAACQYQLIDRTLMRYFDDKIWLFQIWRMGGQLAYQEAFSSRIKVWQQCQDFIVIDNPNKAGVFTIFKSYYDATDMKVKCQKLEVRWSPIIADTMTDGVFNKVMCLKKEKGEDIYMCIGNDLEIHTVSLGGASF